MTENENPQADELADELAAAEKLAAQEAADAAADEEARALMADEPPAIAWIEYVEGDECSLPGYLNAVPSIVSAGDVFSIDGQYLDEVTVSDRFVEAYPPTPIELSPNGDLTKAELGDKLGLDEAAVRRASKESLVAQADELDAKGTNA